MAAATHAADGEIIRRMAEQVAQATILEYSKQHPEKPKMDLPAPLKWAGAVCASIMTVGVSACCIWVVSTLSELQVTVARIDERQQLQPAALDARFGDIERRVNRLEEIHRLEGRK